VDVKKMMEITKESIRQQIGCFVQEQNGWSEFIENCIDAKICSNCGDDLYVDKGCSASVGKGHSGCLH
jgi:hypothetical protein